MEINLSQGNVIVYFDPDNREWTLNIGDGYDDVTFNLEEARILLSILKKVQNVLSS